jgi:hypothetical protein
VTKASVYITSAIQANKFHDKCRKSANSDQLSSSEELPCLIRETGECISAIREDAKLMQNAIVRAIISKHPRAVAVRETTRRNLRNMQMGSQAVLATKYEEGVKCRAVYEAAN